MKHVKVDMDDKILGYYDSDISQPPIGAEEISNKKWREALHNGSTHFKDGKFSIIIQPKTQEQKVDDIANYIISIHDMESKDTKYYFGWGFKNGIQSLARHPNHIDAIKLNNWIDESWNQASIWFNKITTGEKSIDFFTPEKIKELLPDINNF
jgi:hypothetical protein